MDTLYMKSSIGGFFFDVIFKESYDFENVITQHPVQSGANINDHVYSQPLTATFDIGMSDCLTDIVSGQFSGGVSRSANAFDILEQIKASAIAVDLYFSINGRYFPYHNMVIKSLQPTKDKTTMNAFRCTVVLQQINVVNVTTIAVAESAESADPQTTGSTNGGTTTAQTVDGGTSLGAKIISAWQAWEAVVDAQGAG